MEVTKFINNCMQNKQDQINAYKTPTLFGNNDAKISLCCLILLSGQSIQEGFGFVIRIKQVILKHRKIVSILTPNIMIKILKVLQLKSNSCVFGDRS